MDPMTAAMSFATIVSLLSSFKSERSSGQLPEFIAWLKDKRHEDVAARIERNEQLASSLTEILALNHNELIGRFNALDQTLSSIASHMEEFSHLAAAVSPTEVLSNQALSIVKQLVESGAKEFWELGAIGRPVPQYQLMGVGGSLEITEPRFVEDDLDILVTLGILKLGHGSKGTKQYKITRAAVALAGTS
jgi:hypothetical protein